MTGLKIRNATDRAVKLVVDASFAVEAREVIVRAGAGRGFPGGTRILAIQINAIDRHVRLDGAVVRIGAGFLRVLADIALEHRIYRLQTGPRRLSVRA